MEFLTIYGLPAIGTILSIMAVPLGALAAASLVKLFQKLGLDVEAKNRDAFQTSITNAAILAASKMGGPLAASKVSSVVLEEAVKMVEASVPDAVEKFKASSSDIAKRVQSQAELILQSTPTQVSEIITNNPLDGILSRVVVKK